MRPFDFGGQPPFASEGAFVYIGILEGVSLEEPRKRWENKFLTEKVGDRSTCFLCRVRQERLDGKEPIAASSMSC